MQNYLEKLLLFVKNEIKSGKSKEDILKAQSIPGAEDFQLQPAGRLRASLGSRARPDPGRSSLAEVG
jgi:hypothetical protein